MKNGRITGGMIVFLFFVARLVILISVPYETVPGYGDYWNFYSQAKLGTPFIHYWTEFPPLFPFISKVLFSLVEGRETAYSYALAITISIFQAGSVALILVLGRKYFGDLHALSRTWVYLVMIVGLFYSWSYFDPISVFFMLFGIHLIFSGKDYPAAIMIALGALTKWFPILVIPTIWKIRPSKRALSITALVIVIVVIVWSSLYFINPQFTRASLESQANKGSWESVWALIDKNLTTGNFAPSIDRKIPDHAKIPTGKPAVISPIITLALFGGIGLLVMLRSNIDTDLKALSFIGLTLVIFFLWSPGYSPQWVLYILPFCLLCLNINEALLFSAILLLLNLLEWPVLLSRGLFESLNYIIPARTAMMIFLGSRFYTQIKANSNQTQG